MKLKDFARRFLFVPIICFGMLVLILLYSLISAMGFLNMNFDWVDREFIPTKQNNCVTRLKHPFMPKTKAEGKGDVDINNASAEELDTLPEIGKNRSEAIIKQRRLMGGFSCINDLLCTPGIGAKTFKVIKPYIRISEYKGND